MTQIDHKKIIKKKYLFLFYLFMCFFYIDCHNLQPTFVWKGIVNVK